MKRTAIKLVLIFVFFNMGPLKLFAQNLISPFDRNYDKAKAANNTAVTEEVIYSGEYPQLKTLSERENQTGLLVPLDGTFQVAMARNDDQYTSQIALPFTFDFYGTELNSFFINNNGNISFYGGYGTYTPYSFPINSFPMLAPFWSDVDTRPIGSGLVYYRIEPHRVVVTWDNVGYYNNQADKKNTFQVVFTDGTDPLIGLGNNVAFSYADMQWTTGSASGGTGGFGGTPATVGINKGDGQFFALIGRFDHAGSDYDGPGGSNDGISYLDDKVFTYKVSSGDFTQYNHGGIYLKIQETANTNQVNYIGYKYQYKIPFTSITIIKNSDYYLVVNGQAFITEPTFPFLSTVSSDFLDQIILYDNGHNKIGHINFDYEFRWEGTHTRHAFLFLHNDPSICGSNEEYFPYNEDSPNNPPNKKYNYYDIGEYPVSMLIPPHFPAENDMPEGYRFPEDYNSKPILFVHGLTGTFSYQDEAKPNKTEFLGDQVSYWFNTERKVNQKMEYGNRKYHAWQFYYPNEDDLRHCGLMLGKAVEKLYGYYQQPINIVTHSMGGLVTMEYLTTETNGDPNYNEQKIGKILLSMPPIHGSLASNRNYRTNLGWFMQYFGQDGKAPCYRDMSIGSDFIYNLHERVWNSALKNNTFVLMGLTNDWYKWPEPYNALHTEASKHQDGPVSYSSASLLDKGIGFAGIIGNHDDGRYGKTMDANFLPDFIDDYFTANSFDVFRSKCQINDGIKVFVNPDGYVVKPTGMDLGNLAINKNDVDFQKGLVTLLLGSNRNQILYLYKRETSSGTYIKDYFLSPNNGYSVISNHLLSKLGTFHSNMYTKGLDQMFSYYYTKNFNTNTDAGFEFDNYPGPMNLMEYDVFGWPTILNPIYPSLVQHQFHYTEQARAPLLLANESTPTKLLKSTLNNNNLKAYIYIDNQTTQAKFFLYSETAALNGIPYNIRLISPDGSEIDSTTANTIYFHDPQTSVNYLTVQNIVPGVWQMLPTIGSGQPDNLGMITKGELVSDLRTESLINKMGNSSGSNILLKGIIKIPEIALCNLDSLRIYVKINRELYSYDSILLNNFQVVDTGIVFSNSFFIDSTGLYNYIITINGVYDNYKFERALYGDFSAEDNSPKLFIPDQEMNTANSFIDLKLPDYLFCQDCTNETIAFNIYLNNSTFSADTLTYEFFEEIHSLYIDVAQGASPGKASFNVDCIISDTITITDTFSIRYTPPGVPINLSATNIDYYSADLNWTSTDLENQWDVIYGPQGFNPQTEGILLTGIAQYPFTLAGLDPETNYDFYVRAVFSESVSYWSWPESFKTLGALPIAICQNIIVSADANCEAFVTAEQVDNGSYDPSGGGVTLFLTPSGPYPIGENEVILTVSNGGQASTCFATIAVEDNTTPVITAISEPIILWPPNHKYEFIDVGQLLLSVYDNCSILTHSDVYISKVSSDEEEDATGNGDGKTKVDILIAPDCKSVNLRKERSGNGNGRVYTICMAVDDGNGNSGTTSCQVHVPHNSDDIAIDDGISYLVLGECALKSSTILPLAELSQNFDLTASPNPFTRKTSISFTMPESNSTIVKVYNSLGYEVALLYNDFAEAGHVYTVEFDAMDLSKGMYVCRLLSGNNARSMKKLILVK